MNPEINLDTRFLTSKIIEAEERHDERNKNDHDQWKQIQF